MSFKKTARKLKKAKKFILFRNILIFIILAIPLFLIFSGKLDSISDALLGRASVTRDDFLIAQGKDLTYRGVKVVLRGVNFDNVSALGADIGSNDVNDMYFYEEDYRRISELGGNHVRLGLSYTWYEQDRDQFFRKVDEQIAWARKHNVWVTLLNFINPDGGDGCYEGYSNHCSLWTNSTYQRQLTDFWLDVANHYKNEPAVAGYDLVNEPTPPGPNWCNTWFNIAQDMSVKVTAAAPNQLIFIEACDDPSFNRIFKDANGNKATNIVYEVHDYEPMNISHPGYKPAASRIKTYPTNSTVWTENGEETLFYDYETMIGNRYPHYSLAKKISIDWARKNNVPLYVGEWGAQSWTVNYDEYIRDKARIYNQLGVNHAYYTWKHDIDSGWRWGIVKNNGSKTDEVKLAAVRLALEGSIKPQFGEKVTPPPAPSPTPANQPSPTPQVTPAPVPSPSPTPVPSPIVNPQPGEYPRVLSTTNPKIQFVEIQPPVGNQIFVKAEVDSSVSVISFDWYINGRWHSHENTAPYSLGGDDNGIAKGLEIDGNSAEIRAVVYYNAQRNFIDAKTSYSLPEQGAPLPAVPSPVPSPFPSPTPVVSTAPTPVASAAPSPVASPIVEPSAKPISDLDAYIDIFENWNTGYCARVVVKNNTDKEIKNWAVSFKLNDAKFTSKWNGRFVNLLGTVTVFPNKNTRWLPANGTNRTVDWCATKKGSNWAPSDIKVFRTL